MPVLTDALRQIKQRKTSHLSLPTETLWENVPAEAIAETLAIAPESLYEEFLELPAFSLSTSDTESTSPVFEQAAPSVDFTAHVVPEKAYNSEPSSSDAPQLVESEEEPSEEEPEAEFIETELSAAEPPVTLPMQPQRGKIALLCGLDTGLRSVGQAANRLAIAVDQAGTSRLLMTLHSVPPTEKSTASGTAPFTEPRITPTPVPMLMRGSYLHGSQEADRRRLLVMLDRCRQEHDQTYLICNADLSTAAGSSLVDFLAMRCDDVYLTATTTQSGDVSIEAVRQVEVRLGRLGRPPKACLFTERAA